MKNFFPMGHIERPDNYSPKELMVGGGLIDNKGKVNTAIYNQWLYRGVFFATDEADGPGTTSSFSFPDIMTVAIIGSLRNFDIRLKKASKLAHEIMTILEAWFEGKQGVNDDDWPFIYLRSGERIEVSAEELRGEAVIKINVFNIYCNVMGRLDEMGR